MMEIASSIRCVGVCPAYRGRLWVSNPVYSADDATSSPSCRSRCRCRDGGAHQRGGPAGRTTGLRRKNVGLGGWGAQVLGRAATPPSCSTVLYVSVSWGIPLACICSHCCSWAPHTGRSGQWFPCKDSSSPVRPAPHCPQHPVPRRRIHRRRAKDGSCSHVRCILSSQKTSGR